jgi:hypothetical protein
VTPAERRKWNATKVPKRACSGRIDAPLIRLLGVAALLAILATPTALAQSVLPDPARTRGPLNPMVTQATIGSTICFRGWTQTVRP